MELSVEQESEKDDLVNRISAYATRETVERIRFLRSDSSGPSIVVNHGDVWVNNLLFTYDEENKPTSVKFVDYQMTRYANAATDLNYYIYTSTPKQMRDEHLEDILRAYLEAFNETLHLLNEATPTLITWDTLWGEFRRYNDLGFMFACYALPAMMASSEEAIDMEDLPTDEKLLGEEFSKRMDKSSSAMRQNKFYLERIAGVVQSMAAANVI